MALWRHFEWLSALAKKIANCLKCIKTQNITSYFERCLKCHFYLNFCVYKKTNISPCLSILGTQKQLWHRWNMHPQKVKLSSCCQVWLSLLLYSTPASTSTNKFGEGMFISQILNTRESWSRWLKRPANGLDKKKVLVILKHIETYCTSFRKFIRFGVATLPLSIAQHVVYSSADSSFGMTKVNS